MGRCAEAVVTNTACVQQLHQFNTAPVKVGSDDSARRVQRYAILQSQVLTSLES